MTIIFLTVAIKKNVVLGAMNFIHVICRGLPSSIYAIEQSFFCILSFLSFFQHHRASIMS